MKSIGFIGLGTMGLPMAQNLLKKGYELTIFNRTRSRADALAAAGVQIADSPMEVAQESDVVITILGDDASVESIYFGPNGIFNGVRRGAIVIDSGTTSPALSRRLAVEAETRLADFLDAPVTGGNIGAEQGTLLFMVGGHSDALEEVRDVLLAMGRKVMHMGPSGSGSEAKLAHNMMVGIHAAALAEALTMAVKAGLDPEQFLELVLGGGASSRLAESKGKRLLNRDFSNQFSLKFMLKDLRLAQSMADALQVPSPMLSNAKHLFQMGEAKGYGEADMSSVIRCYEEWTGVQIQGSKDDSDEGVSDRRRAPRVKVNIPLKISIYQWEQEGAFAGQQMEATLYDLSENGLQVLSPFPLALDMFIVIHFPEDAGLPPVTSRIIRVVPTEGGFRYGCLLSGVPPHVRLRLEEYLQGNIAEE